jgi:hypothetical protein
MVSDQQRTRTPGQILNAALEQLLSIKLPVLKRFIDTTFSLRGNWAGERGW